MGRGRVTRSKLGLLGVAVLTASFVPALGGTAQASHTGGDFACRASALKAPLLGEPWVANPGYVPCRTDHQAAFHRVGPAGLIVASGLVADTSDNPVDPHTGRPTHGGTASASVAYVALNIPGVRLEAYALSATAGRKCLPGQSQPDIGGSTAIAFLRLNGREIPVSIPLRIPLIIGTLYTNYGVKSGNEVLTRAIWLDLPGDANDVIVSEAKGGAQPGTTCPTGP